MLTREALDEFMLSRAGVRPTTQRWYRMHLRPFEEDFPELPDTPQAIQAWLACHGGSPDTVHGAFRAVRALYNQICRWHPDVINPMTLVRAPRQQQKAVRTFNQRELYHLFLQPLSPRDRALLSLLLDTGLRARECARLTWEDVDADGIIVNGKSGERWVPISETTYRLLCTLKVGADQDMQQHVFQGKRGPLGYEGIYKAVHKQLTAAGIKGKRCSPHTFRHTFGTTYAASDHCDPQVLQKIMGHRDFKTTLRYIHSNRSRMSQNHQQCSPLKALDAVAQGSFFAQSALQEVEEIISVRRSPRYPVGREGPAEAWKRTW